MISNSGNSTRRGKSVMVVNFTPNPCNPPDFVDNPSWRNTLMYQRTSVSKFLTHLLHSPVYRKAHDIDSITKSLQDTLFRLDRNREILPVIILHYVSDCKNRTCLAITALVNSDSCHPGSCIQGEVSEGANTALRLCSDLGIPLFSVIPASYTTDLSGIHVTARA